MTAAPNLSSDTLTVNRDAVYQKAFWRFVPLLALCLVAAYIDRVNIGFAKLTMLDDLSFSNAVYGLGAGIFFIGYACFEVPSNVLMHKIGARAWIARIMITWGVIGAAMAFVTTPTEFYILRFLLGIAEAGFTPGVMYFYSCWFPSARRGKLLAMWLTAVPLSSVIGSPLSGWILAAMDGVNGLHGWQWIFIIETIPSIVLGVLVYLLLRNKPADAKWLSTEEVKAIESDIALELARNHDRVTFMSAFKSKIVWQLSVAYLCIVSSVYVLLFWLPTLIKQHGINDTVEIGWLTTIPYFSAIVLSVWNSSRSDRLRERRWHTAVPCIITAIGMALSWMNFDSLALTILVLSIAAAGASTAQAAFWSMPPTFLSGAAAAAGIALINSIGSVGGMISSSAVGWIADMTGRAQDSLILFSGVLFISTVVILILPSRLVDH